MPAPWIALGAALCVDFGLRRAGVDIWAARLLGLGVYMALWSLWEMSQS